MKYIYDTNGKYITTTYDNISDEDILDSYPDAFITNIRYEKPVVINNKLIETADEKVTLHISKDNKIIGYIKGDYTLDKAFDNQLIVLANDFDVNDLKFYYVENGILKIKLEEKNKYLQELDLKKLNDAKQIILKKANNLKHETLNKGYIFKDNLRQPCREQDKTSVMAYILQSQATKRTNFMWKFFDKDTGDHIYENISIQDLIKIGETIAIITLKAMKSESLIIKDVEKILSIEDLDSYDVEAKFSEYIKL